MQQSRRLEARRVETEPVFRWFDWVLFAVLSGLILAASAGFARYWLLRPGWGEQPVAFSILTLLLSVWLLVMLVRWCLLPLMRRPRPIACTHAGRVAVVTTFVPRHESLEMLAETLEALVDLEQPHDTWVLDEGNDPHVVALCERLGARHFSRLGRPEYQTPSGRFRSRTKYGNVNAWLDAVGFERYDFIASFDPDHVPEPQFLTRVLGYFEDPGVGYVQAPQVYYNQRASFIARGAAEETYGYYATMQMASYGLGYPIVTGCHNTHRVTALREVGGFAAHDADDLLITMHYRHRGWRGVYVPETLARGLTPVDWQGYLAQQRRWARSVLDIKLRHFAGLARSMPWSTRLISFLHGFCYLHLPVSVLLGLVLGSFVVLSGHDRIAGAILSPSFFALFGVLFACDFYRQRFYLDPRRECGLHWRAGLVELAKWPQVFLAFCEVLLNKRLAYVVTPKVRTSQQHPFFVPHLLVAMWIALIWGVGTWSAGGFHPLIHTWLGVIVAGSVGLAWTASWSFPEPYDARLRRAGTRPVRRTRGRALPAPERGLPPRTA